MDAMSEVFLQYTSYLEKEQEIKTNILSAIKSLETISYAITLQMERMHNSVDDKNIQKTCELIKNELLKAKEAYKDLAAVVPINQFYRYNYLFRNHTQKMVQATALLVYFKEDRLVKMEEVALLLGLKSFEASLQISEDTSSLQKMSFADARTSSPETKPPSSEQNVAGGENVREEHSGSKPPVFTGLEDSIKSCEQVMNLAVSCTGTKLILTPASPRPKNSRSSSTDSEDFLPSLPAADTSYSRTLAQDSADPAASELDRPTASKVSGKPTELDTISPNVVGDDEAAPDGSDTAVFEETGAVVSDEPVAPAEDQSRDQTRSADETALEGCGMAVTTAAGPRTPCDGGSSTVAPAVTQPEVDVVKVLRPRIRCESEDFSNGPMSSASVLLFLDIEDFLIGCLMIGSELARLAVNAVSTGNFGLPFCINQFLRELHAGYTQLHLKNSFLRKTYDELKYSLKKTEDVVYNLSLRGLKPTDSGQGRSAKERVVEEEK